MPRSQRRRRRGPAQYQGPRKTKPPFPINLIFNVKAFYLFFIIVMIASMAAVGLGSGLGSSNNNAVDVVENDETPVPTPATQTFPNGPAPIIDATQPHTAILTTAEGEIEIALVQDAPNTVNSFAFLAAKGFYDGTVIFFKDEFFAQGGDPTCVAEGDFVCTGLGGPGYTLALRGIRHHARPVGGSCTGTGRWRGRDARQPVPHPPARPTTAWTAKRPCSVS